MSSAPTIEAPRLRAGEVYHGRAEDVLPLLAPRSLDAVITDPPFGTASPTKVQKQSGGPGGDGLVFRPFEIEWDETLPLDWIPAAAAALRPGGSVLVFTDVNEMHTMRAALADAGLQFRQNFFWVRTNPPPQPRKNFQSAVSGAIFAVKAGKRLWWGGGGSAPNFVQHPLADSTETVGTARHDTQKPLGLVRLLVRLLVPPGGLVCDPFIGSGTLAEAAVLEGRKWIGVEKDPRWVAATRLRMNRAMQPLPGMSEVPSEWQTSLEDLI